jgi:hypothetical protein
MVGKHTTTCIRTAVTGRHSTSAPFNLTIPAHPPTQNDSPSTLVPSFDPVSHNSEYSFTIVCSHRQLSIISSINCGRPVPASSLIRHNIKPRSTPIEIHLIVLDNAAALLHRGQPSKRPNRISNCGNSLLRQIFGLISAHKPPASRIYLHQNAVRAIIPTSCRAKPT